MKTVGEVKVFVEKAGVGSQYIREMIEAYVKVAPVLYAEKMTSGGYYNEEVSNQHGSRFGRIHC